MMHAETLQATQPDLHPEARLVALAAPDSAAAEQYRVLHQRMLRLAARRPLRIVAVTSAGRREGRTLTAANLAMTAAREGRVTVLVEADLRRPALGRLLGLAPRPVVAEVIACRAALGQASTVGGFDAPIDHAGNGTWRGQGGAGPAPVGPADGFGGQGGDGAGGGGQPAGVEFGVAGGFQPGAAGGHQDDSQRNGRRQEGRAGKEMVYAAQGASLHARRPSAGLATRFTLQASPER